MTPRQRDRLRLAAAIAAFLGMACGALTASTPDPTAGRPITTTDHGTDQETAR